MEKAKENVCEDFMLAIVKALNASLFLFIQVRFCSKKLTKHRKTIPDKTLKNLLAIRALKIFEICCFSLIKLNITVIVVNSVAMCNETQSSFKASAM